jgi:hypothetical protein
MSGLFHSCVEELDTKDTGDAQLDNTHVPWIRLDREVYFYAGHKINIVEAMDSHGGVIWPAVSTVLHYMWRCRQDESLLLK